MSDNSEQGQSLGEVTELLRLQRALMGLNEGLASHGLPQIALSEAARADEGQETALRLTYADGRALDAQFEVEIFRVLAVMANFDADLARN